MYNNLLCPEFVSPRYSFVSTLESVHYTIFISISRSERLKTGKSRNKDQAGRMERKLRITFENLVELKAPEKKWQS